METTLVRLVVIIVSAVWVISILADVFLEGYEVPPSVHLAMMAVVGGATGRYIIQRNGRDK